jgi:ADP-ribosylglycohydrolase
MLGAIAGDIIGSIYERQNIKTKAFPLFGSESRFTDDTVLTVAVAETLLENGSYVQKFHDYFHRYPDAGYGGTFRKWATAASQEPYNSWGNGSAMRVSPIGFAFNQVDQVLEEAARSAAVTHNHPEGVKGAQATAVAILLARQGNSKTEIRDELTERFGYSFSQSLSELRPTYTFDVSCQGSVPPAILAFLESTDFEDAIRNAISIGGDSDTIACIAGGIAHAFYGEVPEAIAQQTLARLDLPMRTVVERFMTQYV